MTTFISPFTDFGFKKIFGQEPHKDILIDFLNQVLALENVQIKDLTYKKGEFAGQTGSDRKAIFDLYCENEKGEKFIVEMQKTEQVFFKDRTLYYSTFPIQEQAPQGNWNYELKAVFCIAILGFTLDYEEEHKTIIRYVKLTDQKTKKVFYDKLTYIFIQIPAFNKTVDQLETRLDQWLYLLKHLDTFERIPEHIKDKIFQKVFRIAEYSNMNKKEKITYQESLKHYRDMYSILTTAQKRGLEEGLQEGLQKGLQEGLQKGLQEGLQKGLQEGLQKGYEKAEKKYHKSLKKEKQRAEQEIADSIKRALESGMSIAQVKAIFQTDEDFLKKYNLI